MEQLPICFTANGYHARHQDRKRRKERGRSRTAKGQKLPPGRKRRLEDISTQIAPAQIVLGIDPGLRRCGWGLVRAQGSRLQHLAHGVISPDTKATLGQRLVQLEQGLDDILDAHAITTVAVEQTFQNTNPQATLALGMARGICLLAPAKRGLPVTDYAPNTVKKSLVGRGHAQKDQVSLMVRHLLGVAIDTGDETDALALAICHAHHGGINTGLYQQGLAP